MAMIVIASHNPVKMQATLVGFQKMFPGQAFEILTADVQSEVSDQPYSSEETLKGAHNRVANAVRLYPSADFWVGIEGGVEENPDGLVAFAWIVVQSAGLMGKGRTGTFFLPPEVAYWVRQGKELGEADDIVFNRTNSKQANGAIGILTGDVIDRAQLYEMAVILALVPFKNPDLYREK